MCVFCNLEIDNLLVQLTFSNDSDMVSIPMGNQCAQTFYNRAGIRPTISESELLDLILYEEESRNSSALAV